MSNLPPDPDDLETARRRVRYRAAHRGTKELDIILGGFADARAADFDAETLRRFEKLLAHEEMELQDWLLGNKEIPAGADGHLLRAIRAFQQRRAALPPGEASL